MRLMRSDQVTVLERHLARRLRIGHRPSRRWSEPRAEIDFIAQKLAAQSPSEHLCQRGRHGVAELALHGGQRPEHRVIVRHGLEAAELASGEAPALPVEGPDGRPRLRLNRPGGERLRELQKEAPIAPPPAEQGQPTATLRVPEIVLTLRNRRQEVRPLTPHPERRIVVLLQIVDRVPGRGIALQGRLRKGEFRAVARSDHEDPLPGLRDPEIRGVEPADAQRIAHAAVPVDRFDRPLNQRQPLGLAPVGEAWDVLQEKGFRQCVAEHAQVSPQRAGPGVAQAERVAGGPIAGFRERLTGGTADQSVRLALREARRGEDLPRGERVDVAVQHRPAPVVPQGGHGLGIDLHRDRGLEPDRLEAEIEPARARVEAESLALGGSPPHGQTFLSLSVSRTRRATASGSEWTSDSQNRSTVQPISWRRRELSRSRSMFRWILATQYPGLVPRLSLVCRPSQSRPCQKSPSTKTATLAPGKTTSGRP